MDGPYYSTDSFTLCLLSFYGLRNALVSVHSLSTTIETLLIHNGTLLRIFNSNRSFKNSVKFLWLVIFYTEIKFSVVVYLNN